MARGRKLCEFCSDDREVEYKDSRNGFCVWLETYPLNNIMAFMAQANDENGEMMEESVEVQMNYCPVCGRKLV